MNSTNVSVTNQNSEVMTPRGQLRGDERLKLCTSILEGRNVRDLHDPDVFKAYVEFALISRASSRTLRYFINTSRFIIDDVIATFFYIRGLHYEGTLVQTRLGDVTACGDYSFPDHWSKLVSANRVYLSKSCLSALPMVSNEYSEVSALNLLSPSDIELFFEQYNVNQPDDGKVALSRVAYRNDIVLSDFEGFVAPLGEDDITGWVPVNSDATFSATVALMNGYELPFSVQRNKYIVLPFPGKEEIALWLMFNKKTKSSSTTE